MSYFSYLGGSGDDVGTGIAVDANQGARVTGWTDSTNFPITTSTIQGTPGGGKDAFVARIDTSSTGNYTTYLGGAGDDVGTSIAVDNQGSAYVTGETNSSPFPLVNPFQNTLQGPTDAFASKIGPTLGLAVTGTATPSPVGVGSQISYAFTITNNGDYTNNITFTDVLPSSGNATFTSATSSPGSCGSANGGTVLCNIGSLNNLATATVTVVLVPTVGGTLGNTGTVGVTGTNFGVSPNPAPSSVVNDFALAVSPASVTVPAGVPASYTAVVTPTGSIPDSVSLSCSSGLPSGATCSVTTNPIPNLDTGAASTTLVINTTARVTTTTGLWPSGRPLYATWLPVCGLTLLGVGFSGKRRRRILFGLIVALALAGIAFMPGCSSHTSTTTTTGTPAGSYTVTVSATSGTAVRTTTIQLVVQ